ncbi:hypothetical protein [Streptomyces xanthophaeus]|uniref:hypothetical protein n=1 Tax=Streptomyces xanthophaeus TaxID=67385 RepID=UPI00233F4E56|nr:hypothetical protein [Streptomyces xanthophaeus]
MARRRRTKKQRPTFGIPREAVLMAAQDAWPYTFVADDLSGGCGKVPMPSDAALEDVQAAVSALLTDYTRSCHGVEIAVAWSPLTPDSWVGRVSRVATDATPPRRAVPEAG